MATLLEKRGDILDTKVPLLTRIKFPRVWKQIPGDITIEDLQEEKFDEALEHIKKYYLVDERLCRLACINEDTKSTENYLKLIRWWMQDTQSLIAINEATGKIVGVLIERVLDLYLMKTLSRMMLYHGEALKRMQTFLISMSKFVNINKMYNTEYYNQIFIWSVEPGFRNNGVGKALLQACKDQTRSLKVTILIGIFTSTQTQKMAKSEGFKFIYERPYNWKENSQILFEDIGNEDKTAKMMTLKLDGSDYGRNICEEIMQKYKITRLMKKNVREHKDPNNTKDQTSQN